MESVENDVENSETESTETEMSEQQDHDVVVEDDELEHQDDVIEHEGTGAIGPVPGTEPCDAGSGVTGISLFPVEAVQLVLGCNQLEAESDVEEIKKGKILANPGDVDMHDDTLNVNQASTSSNSESVSAGSSDVDNSSGDDSHEGAPSASSQQPAGRSLRIPLPEWSSDDDSDDDDINGNESWGPFECLRDPIQTLMDVCKVLGSGCQVLNMDGISDEKRTAMSVAFQKAGGSGLLAAYRPKNSVDGETCAQRIVRFTQECQRYMLASMLLLAGVGEALGCDLIDTGLVQWIVNVIEKQRCYEERQMESEIVGLGLQILLYLTRSASKKEADSGPSTSNGSQNTAKKLIKLEPRLEACLLQFLQETEDSSVALLSLISLLNILPNEQTAELRVQKCHLARLVSFVLLCAIEEQELCPAFLRASDRLVQVPMHDLLRTIRKLLNNPRCMAEMLDCTLAESVAWALSSSQREPRLMELLNISLSFISVDSIDLFLSRWQKWWRKLHAYSSAENPDLQHLAKQLYEKMTAASIAREERCGHIQQCQVYHTDDFVDCPDCSALYEYSCALLDCARKGDCDRAKSVVKNVPRKLREQLVKIKKDGVAPLFEAAQNGHAEMVRFFLDECGSDLEQSGEFDHTDHSCMNQGTALWVATQCCHLEVVKVLVGKGAEVGTTSYTHFTPLHTACCEGEEEIVQYLLENGANVNARNLNGGTALMYACNSISLCKMLLDSGAEVRIQEDNGSSPLSIAAMGNELEVLKLLIEHGADPDQKCVDAEDTLTTAALEGSVDVVNYLMANHMLTVEKKIEVLSLLGATHVSTARDIPKAISVWQDALDLRNEHNLPERVDISLENWGVKPITTKEQLQELESDEAGMISRSMWLRDDILGRYHPDTLQFLKMEAGLHNNLDSNKSLQLYQKSLTRGHKTDDELSLHSHCMDCLLLLHRALSTQWGDVANPDLDLVQNTISVLNLGIEEASCVQSILKRRPITSIQLDCLTMLMRFFLHMVKLLSAIKEDSMLRPLVMQAVCRLVRMDLHDDDGCMLLHLAMLESSSWLDGDKFTNMPNKSTIELLLQCAAPVNALDHQKNTPLHLCCREEDLPLRDLLESANFEVEDMDEDEKVTYQEICQLLYQHDAHLDAMNLRLRKGWHVLKAYQVKFDRNQLLSLQCLAARALRDGSKNKIKLPEKMDDIHNGRLMELFQSTSLRPVMDTGKTYRGQLPTFLEEFVDMH